MDKEAEIARIKAEFEAKNREIDKQHRNAMAKLYGGAALQLGSAFIPGTLGLKAAGGAIKALTPYVGKKIAENVATGTISGLASGAVEGLGRGLLEKENPLKTMVSDATLGTLFGGAFGLAGGKIGKKLAEKNLQNNNIAPQKYFDDYVAGLAKSDTLGKASPFSQEFMKFKGLRDSFTPVSKNSGSEFLFAGENALNADINALTEAERMSLYEDAKNLDTWKQTGWFKGVDGKWRYELPNGKLKDDIKWLELGPDDNTFLSAKLPNVYDNPTFFEAYPEAKDISVYVNNLDYGTAGAYNELGQYIDLDKSFNYLKTDLEKMKLLEELRQDPLYIKAHNYDKPPADIRKDYLEYKNSDLYKKEDELIANLSIEGWNDKALNTLQHEIQHFIQGKENFARGGDVQAGYDRYKKLAGEVEARAVEARSKLTPEQMQEYAPFIKSNYGYDVAPTKQILKSFYGDYGKGKVYSTKKNDLYAKLTDNSVDLTNDFNKTPTIQEVKTHIKDLIDSGKVFDTLDDDWKIDIRGNTAKIDHIAKSSKYGQMNKSKRNRHNKYVMSLENLINNSKYTHLKDNTKPLKKPNIDKYHYFETNVKIGDKKYKVILNAEQYKGESTIKPQTVHLYDVLEVK